MQIKSGHFKNRDYWLHCRPALKAAFNNLCAYSAMIVNGPGEVDHFIAKTLSPLDAYSWHNFRFASSDMNRKKPTTANAVLDPFQIGPDWFYVDLPTYELRYSNAVPVVLRQRAQNTIDSLGLNDENWKLCRESWLSFFIDRATVSNADLLFLRSMAPLLADALVTLSQNTGSPVITP